MTNDGSGSTSSQPPTREEELARKAAKLVKASKPQLKSLMAVAKPRPEEASKHAARYVREHENEIKDAALKLARTRLPGPIGMAVGALANGMPSETPQSAGACPKCATKNPPPAKFCSECGSSLVENAGS